MAIDRINNKSAIDLLDEIGFNIPADRKIHRDHIKGIDKKFKEYARINHPDKKNNHGNVFSVFSDKRGRLITELEKCDESKPFILTHPSQNLHALSNYESLKGIYFSGLEEHFKNTFEETVEKTKDPKIKQKIKEIFSEREKMTKIILEKKLKTGEKNKAAILSLIAFHCLGAKIYANTAIKEAEREAALSSAKTLLNIGHLSIEEIARIYEINSQKDIEILTKYVIEDGPAKNAITAGNGYKKVKKQFGITKTEDKKALKNLANEHATGIKKLFIKFQKNFFRAQA